MVTQSGMVVKGKRLRATAGYATLDNRTKLCWKITCEKLIREADFYTLFYYAGWPNFKLEWWTIFRLTNTGLENLGEKLMKSESFELALDELVWLITLLANAAIQRQNVKNPDSQKPLLTDDEVEILTSPFEIAGYREAITEAMFKGTSRNILSEEDAAADPNAETG